ncbi:MAG: 50S ribosomal protein L16 [Candidatus Heimdallarchaeota archaeon]|nr:50S ribosomal protein L16 [Candidatus Heimdallarchaeota archaeon]
MGKRPAYCYSRIDRPAYTRKKYIKGGPEPKIKSFDFGSPGTDFPVEVSVFMRERCQISHNALEAARIHVNRYLTRKIGRENYHYRVCVYPHHRMRENKMMTGAGADRIQNGMRLSFGKIVSVSARVYENDRVLFIRTKPEYVNIAKDALRRGKAKFPRPSKIKITKGEELVN